MKSIVAVLVLLFFSCSKKTELTPNNSHDQTITPCIKTKVDNFKVNAKSGYNIKQYLFKGDRVYVFDNLAQFVDGANPVINSACDTLCWLGGFTGNTSCSGVNFYNSATQENTIFEAK